MSQAKVFDGSGKETGTVDLPEAVFDAPVHEAAMHQALLRQLANARQGTHQTRTRGEVSGGGKKPWKQKGTGRARQGSTRAPQWRHGGTVFGPHPRGYEQKMPRKQRRLALRAALAAKSQADQLRVVDGLAQDAPKTRQMADLFVELGTGPKTLFVLPAHDLTIEKSTRNLPWVKTILLANLNVFDVLEADTIVLTREVLPQLAEQLA